MKIGKIIKNIENDIIEINNNNFIYRIKNKCN